MKKIFSILLFLSAVCPIFGQTTSDCHKEGGMFISEMANFGHGEYVEFTVYGSSSNPTAPVNLEGWIVDDNNKPKMDVGNESGHIRLGDEFSAVTPGTLIVLCSNKNKPTEISGFPYFTRNSNYIVTFGKGLVGVDNCPNHSGHGGKPNSPDYNCSSTASFSDFKDYAALDNDHDAIQVRNREGELVHALYWTDEYQEAGNPKAVDISSILNLNPTRSVRFSVIRFEADKDWYNLKSFKNKTQGSPGISNSTEHQNLINALQSGAFSTSLKASVNVKQQPSSKDNDGVVEVVIDGGNPTFSISINKDNRFIKGGFFDKTGTFTFENLAEGLYNVIIDDVEACYLEINIKLDKAKPICGLDGECKEIGEAGWFCKYEWLAPIPSAKKMDAKVKVCPSETTTYKVKTIDFYGNYKEFSYTVEVKTATTEYPITLICPNQTATLSVKGKEPVWSTGEKTNTITVFSAGLYSVTVIDEGGCKIKGNFNVEPYSADKLKEALTKLGFIAFPIKILTPVVITPNGSNKPLGIVTDYANFEYERDGFIDQSTPTSSKMLAKLNAVGVNANGYCTKNEMFCNGDKFKQVFQDFYANTNSSDIWHHYWRNPDGSGNDILFQKMHDYDRYIEQTILSKITDPYIPLLPCKGTNRTGRSGGTAIFGTVESWIVQLQYLLYNPNATLEYQITYSGIGPLKAKSKAKYFKKYYYMDIVDLFTGEIFEVKSSKQQIEAARQVQASVLAANLACPRLPQWNLGLNYIPTIHLNPRNLSLVLESRLYEPGVVLYKPVDRKNIPDPVPLPVFLPQSTLNRIRKFMERLSNNVENIDWEIAKFLEENPSIVKAIKTAAAGVLIGAALVVVIGTIIEDLLTLGAGIWDDAICFTLAYRLVSIALII